MRSENTSPRISFSNDLSPADVVPVDHDESRKDSKLLDMNYDFEFRITSSFQHESSSADELFANGVILPVQISSKEVQTCSSPPTASLPPLPPLPRSSSIGNNPKRESYSLKETMVMKNDFGEKSTQSKSFWGFKRSSSLKCDAKKSLISSLSLLSRSNSTGSTTNKRTSLKDFQKHSSQKLQGSSTPPFSSDPYRLRAKKKNYCGSYTNGVKISHVLNIPPPYISKGTANLFGLGSLLRSSSSGSKDNKKNKK